METITIKTHEYGDLTLPKDFVNELCVIFDEASESYSKRNRPALSKRARKMCDLMFNSLDETGYFDDVK